MSNEQARPAERERDAAVAETGEQVRLGREWMERAEKAERERDEALVAFDAAREAALKAMNGGNEG